MCILSNCLKGRTVICNWRPAFSGWISEQEEDKILSEIAKEEIGEIVTKECVQNKIPDFRNSYYYPPYSSKWNPVEHRLFCHLYKAANGVVFDCYQTVMDTFSKTQTSTGLTVVIRLNLKYYQTGQKIEKKEVDYQKITPSKDT
jgi:hypothetical protein